MRICFTISLIIHLNLSLFGRSTDTLANKDSITTAYEQAFQEIKLMLASKQQLSFKRAVFVTENAYYQNSLNYNFFSSRIAYLAGGCNAWTLVNSLLYDEKDYDNVIKNASIFYLMKDTLWLTKSLPLSLPFQYDFNDFMGFEDWTNMFVYKLMKTHKGNCHSLPYLYLILAEELGAKAWLGLAPNHLYIKNYCKKIGWYNTELTSAEFPIDGWIMASGYVHTDAIVNALFMDTLSRKESVALCLVDLAKGYERKTGAQDGSFILKCCDLALNYFPDCVTAMLLKAETLNKLFQATMKTQNAASPQDVFLVQGAKQQYEEMEHLYVKLYESGYREMPPEMYAEWLTSLQTYRSKYIDKKLNFIRNKN